MRKRKTWRHQQEVSKYVGSYFKAGDHRIFRLESRTGRIYVFCSPFEAKSDGWYLK